MVMDLAHNEAGLEAMLEIMSGVRRPGARLLLGLGAVGDRHGRADRRARRDRGARAATWWPSGTRSTTCAAARMDEIDALLRAGAERVGVTDIESYHTEVGAWRRWSPRPTGRRRRADVPRRAPGGLRLARRARRHAGLPGRARGARCAPLRCEHLPGPDERARPGQRALGQPGPGAEVERAGVRGRVRAAATRRHAGLVRTCLWPHRVFGRGLGWAVTGPAGRGS